MRRARVLGRADGNRPSRVRLRGTLSPVAAETLDPRSSEITVRVTDAAGPVLCSTITAPAWVRAGRRRFTFRDRSGSLGGGLVAGKLVGTRTGGARFDLHGTTLPVRSITGGTLSVTVSAGGHCWRASTAARSR